MDSQRWRGWRSHARCVVWLMMVLLGSLQLVTGHGHHTLDDLPTAACSNSTDATFACSSTLHEGVQLMWTVDPSLRVLRGKLDIVTNKEVYISWGLTEDGNMAPGDAIICLPGEGTFRYWVCEHSAVSTCRLLCGCHAWHCASTRHRFDLYRSSR